MFGTALQAQLRIRVYSVKKKRGTIEQEIYCVYIVPLIHVWIMDKTEFYLEFTQDGTPGPAADESQEKLTSQEVKAIY